MSILLLYGSETGTAQDIAESLRRESEMRHVPARAIEMDDLEMESLQNERVVVFVVSTTGQGEMPPNMRKSWKFLLRKSLTAEYFQNVNMSVVGLGDSTYQKFNFAGKKLYRRLLQLGVKMMTDLCLADDQHEIGIDGALIPWKKRLWDTVYSLSLFPEMTKLLDLEVTIEPKYVIEDVDLRKLDEKVDMCRDDQQFAPLRVANNTRVTSEDHYQDTRLVRFIFEEADRQVHRFNSGDVLMVKPYNPKETVHIAIEALGYSDEMLDKPVRIVKFSSFVKPPPYYLLGNITTLRICLERYFDLQQIPRRSFFEMLCYYSQVPVEKERLAELASPEGLDDLLDYANRCRRTTAETLRDFHATAKLLKPHHLFEIFSVIRPRAFSIASAPHLNYVELLVAKVEYFSRMSEKRRGLCSTFIARLQPNDEVFCKIRPGTFKFPSSEQPVVCVGPGTGVAPFRSLFFDRSQKLKVPQRTSLLFFGCRGQHKDFYFNKEWPQLEGVEVITAFSRDSEKKVYVQHKMAENASTIKRLLDQGAHIYIAGSSGDMPKAVLGVLSQIKSEEWTKKAEENGIIQFETWT